jgi:hypothetical protein
MNDLLEWTEMRAHNTGLPCTIWVSVRGVVATDPYHPEKLEHVEAVNAWVALNRATLLAHWRGEIDGAELAAHLCKLGS